MLNVPAADLLLKTSGDHRRAYPLAAVRVSTHLGAGQLVYATDDQYLGVQLDGETRVDEYPLTVCELVAS
jgi:hypothetical protein